MGTLLYNRTAYSMLKSTIRISQLIDFAVEQGYSSVGICDQDVLYAVPQARQEAEKKGIRIIYGIETTVISGEERITLLVFAKNDDGFRNISRMSSKISWQRSPLALADFLELNKDTAVIYPDTDSYLTGLMKDGETEKIRSLLGQLRDLIPAIYLGCSRPNDPFWQEPDRMLELIAQRLGIARVALSLALYKDADDFESYQALMAIGQGKSVLDRTLAFERGRELLKPDRLAAYPEAAVRNSDALADQCRVTFTFPKTALPNYRCPDGYDAETYLTQLCRKGLEKRLEGRKAPAVYKERLQTELAVIRKMGFSNYFLIVYDFILKSRRRGIYVGPGRGSVPGSLVAYCLGITHIDPIEHGLLFERFLNPGRVTMPDIDTDVPDDRRQEVIEYLCEEYGTDHVAHIASFGTMASHRVILDVAKALEIPERDLAILLRAMPRSDKLTLRDVYSVSDNFRRLVEADPRFKRLFSIALRLEDLPRNLSTHACGIVIARDRLIDQVPLVRIDDQMMATQYTWSYLEPLGLIKMDILGILNLSIIADTAGEINKTEEFNILKIPRDDAKAFRIFQEARTSGIFQSESAGMRSLLAKIKPESIQEVALAFALFRPATKESIDEYVRRKKDPSLISYPDPALKPVLEETYGLIVYQEQIMRISQILAGFSLGKADILRAAMSKKHPEQIVGLKNEFIAGCIRNGRRRELAEKLYATIEKFATYGFNKSHAIAYALFAYQMAYLKANYPLQFYCALLDRKNGERGTVAAYLMEIRNAGIRVLGPDIQLSLGRYSLADGALRLPLTGIRGVGSAQVKDILAERQRRGPYPDFIECVLRLSLIRIGKPALVMLIAAGALDCFGLTRSGMAESLDTIYSYGELIKTEQNGQLSFDQTLIPRPSLYTVKDDPLAKAEREKEALGFYLSAHPLTKIRERYDPGLRSLDQSIQAKGNIRALVRIQKIKQIRTRRGQPMAFVSAADETAGYEFVFMPELFAQSEKFLLKNQLIYVEGRIDDRNSCLVRQARLVSERNE